MNCCKCKKEVSEEFFNHVKGFSPMTGYNCRPNELPVVDCTICKQPVCGDCIYGHGMFVYTCKGECTDKLKEKVACS